MGKKESKASSTGLTPMLSKSRIKNDGSPNETNKENIPPKRPVREAASRALFDSAKKEGTARSRSKSGQRTPIRTKKTASVSPQKKTPTKKRNASASGDALRDEPSPPKRSPGRPRRDASAAASARIGQYTEDASPVKAAGRPRRPVLELDNVDVTSLRSPPKSSKPQLQKDLHFTQKPAWKGLKTPEESEEEEEYRGSKSAAATPTRRSTRHASVGRGETTGLEETPSKVLASALTSLSVRTPSKGRGDEMKHQRAGSKSPAIRKMTRGTPGRPTVPEASQSPPPPATRQRTPTRASTVAKVSAKGVAFTPTKDVDLKLRLARATSQSGAETWRKRTMQTPRTEGRPPARLATIARRDKDASYEPEDVCMESESEEEGEETSESEAGEEEEEEGQRRGRKRGGRTVAAAAAGGARSVSRARGAAARSAARGRGGAAAAAAVGFRLEVEEDDDRIDLSRAPANLAAALERLAVYRCPRGTLLCREEECAQIAEFIRAAIAPKGISQACYISGVPGTGKTASVMAMLNREAKEAHRRREKFVFIQVNAMCYSDPKQVFSEILYEYEKQTRGEENVRRVAGAAARKRLNGLFECVDEARPPVLMLVDELDQLSTKKQELIYDVFNWSSVERARVSVISIANTLDLPERMLNQRICSRLGMNRIVFQPYTHEEIVSIVKSKLGGVKTAKVGGVSSTKGGKDQDDEESVIDPSSIEMAARKVAAISGDLRKAMDILQAAIKAAIRKGERKLTFAQVKDAISDASETLLVLAARSLSRHQKAVFEAAVDIVRTRDVLDFSMNELGEKYEAIAHLVLHIHPLAYNGVARVVFQLCSMGLLKFVNPNERAVFRRRLRLLPAVHDATSALKIVDQKRAAAAAADAAGAAAGDAAAAAGAARMPQPRQQGEIRLPSVGEACLQAAIGRVAARIPGRLFDVDDQLRSLAALISSVREGAGGSAIVYGQPGSGRSALVERALERHGQGVSTQHLWLSRCGTETNALQTLLDSEASRESRIIVVDSADDLVCKSKQALLYRLLDRAKTTPWLVLLLITNQDMIGCLEKRVRSRLPNVRVFTGDAREETEWAGLTERLLMGEEEGEGEEKKAKPVPSAKSKGKKGRGGERRAGEGQEEEGADGGQRVWAAFVHRCLTDEDVKGLLKRLYEYSGHLAVLKSALRTWLQLLQPADVLQAMNPSIAVVDSLAAFRRAVDDFRRAVEEVAPATEMNLAGLSHRSLCLLVAAARRLRCDPTRTVSYGKLHIDFIHQCHNVDRRMLPDAELQTFKELDRLCELGLLAAVGSSTQTDSFRQLGLNCPLLLLVSAVGARLKNAVALKEWFDSQPVN